MTCRSLSVLLIGNSLELMIPHTQSSKRVGHIRYSTESIVHFRMNSDVYGYGVHLDNDVLNQV